MSPKQGKAIAALLTANSKAEAAAAAGISARTLRTYLQNPDFQRAYRQAFSELVDDATRQMQRSLTPAISTLTEIVADGEQPATARISAARAVLEYSLKLTEQNDIISRLDALEQQMEGDQTI